jgi:hypothetical protein
MPLRAIGEFDHITHNPGCFLLVVYLLVFQASVIGAVSLAIWLMEWWGRQ